MTDKTRFTLNESDLPRSWYNLNADMPVPPAPVLNPQNMEPVTPDFLNVLFPMELIMQEVSTDRYIDIPEEVQDIYKLYRPTPLLRARRLEKILDTPAHIYYKYEGASPAGSHKPNTAIPQAFYNKVTGTKALTTETGAGQWGSALALACQLFDLDLEVYMVKVSYQQKPYRRILMETYGAQVFASPTDKTQFGQSVLEQDPESNGSLGIAIAEAVEAAATSGGAKKYGIGSVLNHVLLHQTIVGEEVLKQMDMADEYPDVVVGCVGGGSNFAGIAYPFLRQNLLEGQRTRLLAVEPTASPSLTKGVYTFDYGDSAKLAPIVKMYTLGHDFVPPPIHAGGLRYHGMAPSLCALYEAGYIEAKAVPQLATFDAAVMFSRAEGILPAPESAHAIRGAIDEALDAKEKGEERVILFNLSGHGHFDLEAYDAYHNGELQDFEYPEEEIAEAMQTLPEVPQPA
ncbi:MAG: TrpB-like pyridoxal phosphate-dependent enzyme [Chloroflexota bacterium]|nr:MAG: TrpB-like pyridoxal phosphate-dependent enzyme [Chloroflexota bacterium]